MRLPLALLALVLTISAGAEQRVVLGDLEVHYVLLASTFLEPEVAARYDIVRARNQGLINLSVLSVPTASEAGAGTATPRAARVVGALTNLLGQQIELEFRELVDGPAIYYIAPFRYSDAELLRFEIQITTADQGGGTLRIEQKLYWD